MADTREKISPDVPTAREEGLDLIAGTYNLLAVPLGTPAVAVDRMAKATARMMNKPVVLDKLAALGITPILNSSPEQARAFVSSEVDRWGAVVKKLGIAL